MFLHHGLRAHNGRLCALQPRALLGRCSCGNRPLLWPLLHLTKPRQALWRLGDRQLLPGTGCTWGLHGAEPLGSPPYPRLSGLCLPGSLVWPSVVCRLFPTTTRGSGSENRGPAGLQGSLHQRALRGMGLSAPQRRLGLGGGILTQTPEHLPRDAEWAVGWEQLQVWPFTLLALKHLVLVGCCIHSSDHSQAPVHATHCWLSRLESQCKFLVENTTNRGPGALGEASVSCSKSCCASP